MENAVARLQKPFLLSTEAISKDVSPFSMGFVRLRMEGREQHAECAGSGTFVSVGSVEGILTAAHVVDRLPTSGRVGICLPADRSEQFSRQTIEMELTDSIVFGTAPFGPNGPDLAFLRPAPESVGWLKAKASFFNLSKRRAEILAHQRPSEIESDVLVGLIHELTEELPRDSKTVKQTQFSILFGPSRLVSLKYIDPHALLYYQPSRDFGFKLPQSFEGMSGGGVWRFYIAKKENEVEAIDRRLIGVAFHQLPLRDGKWEIVCHGQRSVYGALIDKIIERWPEDAKID